MISVKNLSTQGRTYKNGKVTKYFKKKVDQKALLKLNALISMNFGTNDLCYMFK